MSLVNKRLQRPAELKPVGRDALIQSYQVPGAEQVFDISMPLVYSGVRVGALYLGFSQKTIHQSLADARNRALAIAGAMIGLGIVGAIWMSMILAKPIRALVQGTKAIAQQNFNVQVPVF